MEYWTAFTIGLFGSLHCVGMCGPIALTLPYRDQSRSGTLFNILLYNFGRTITYSIIGIIPGIFGLGAFISGYQKSISIGLGILLLVIAFFSINVESQLFRLESYQKFNRWLKNQFAKQFKKENRFAFLTIGGLNGLLPCGLVYMALAGSFTQGSVTGAMTYMFFFGLGTFPLMLLLSFSGHLLLPRFKKYLLRIVPVFLILFGIFFLWRGLAIELPSDLNFWLMEGAEIRCN